MIFCPFFPGVGFLVESDDVGDGPNDAVYDRKLGAPENPEPGEKREEPKGPQTLAIYSAW